MRHSFTRAVLRLLALAAALGIFGGCANTEESGEFYTGWDRGGGCTGTQPQPWGNSLAGSPLGPCMFRGEFVWVSYDALWCKSCRRQAAFSSEAARRGSAHTVFVWVLTGGGEVFRAASESEMRAWAAEFSLDPAWVVSEGASSRSVPQHALIGPDGRTWYRYVGLLDTERMLSTIDDFRYGRRQPPDFAE